eukprot:UN22305
MKKTQCEPLLLSSRDFILFHFCDNLQITFYLYNFVSRCPAFSIFLRCKSMMSQLFKRTFERPSWVSKSKVISHFWSIFI